MSKKLISFIKKGFETAARVDQAGVSNISTLVAFANEDLVAAVEYVQKTRFTGIFKFDDGSFKGLSVEASFKNGFLHASRGAAWTERSGGSNLKQAWARYGVIEAISTNGVKSVLDRSTGQFEKDSNGFEFSEVLSKFNRTDLEIASSHNFDLNDRIKKYHAVKVNNKNNNNLKII